MKLLLIKKNILTLQCQCTIWLSIATIILILLVVYGNLKETNSQNVIMKNFLMLVPDNSSSFKYKSSLIGTLLNGGRKNGVKIVVPLKCLSNFRRSLEMQLINCEVELSLTWNKNCIFSSVADDSNFAITQNIMFQLLL